MADKNPLQKDGVGWREVAEWLAVRLDAVEKELAEVPGVDLRTRIKKAEKELMESGRIPSAIATKTTKDK